MSLILEKLRVRSEDEEIIKGIDFSFENGKIYFVLGPNGSGKSTLCKAIAGVGEYRIKGKIILDGRDITKLKPNDRSKLGIFLAYQHPIEIPEIKYRTFLANVYEERFGNLDGYEKRVSEILRILGIKEELLDRGINHNFSGGEKKKMEILQMLLLEPKYVLLDEIDSGIDVDSLKKVSEAIIDYLSENPETVLILITHHGEISNYISPDVVLVLKNGKIDRIGGKELLKEIKTEGFK